MNARRLRIAGALSADELALWVEVTRSVAPLRPPPRAAQTPTPPQASTPPPAPAAAPPAIVLPAREKPAPVFEPLGRRLRRDIHRGRFGVEGALDLHGLRESEAHAALNGFIRDAHARGLRLVLVVTGKGAREGGGVLRRLTPHWLAQSALRPLVVGFEEAGPTHGGAGALYVRLRRAGRPGA